MVGFCIYGIAISAVSFSFNADRFMQSGQSIMVMPTVHAVGDVKIPRYSVAVSGSGRNIRATSSIRPIASFSVKQNPIHILESSSDNPSSDKFPVNIARNAFASSSKSCGRASSSIFTLLPSLWLSLLTGGGSMLQSFHLWRYLLYLINR